MDPDASTRSPHVQSDLDIPLLRHVPSRRPGMLRGHSAGERRVPDLQIRDHFSLRSGLFRHQDKVVMDSFRHQFIFALEDTDGSREGGGREVVVSVERAARWGTKVAFAQFVYLYIVAFVFGAATIFCLLLFLQFALGIFLTGISNANPDLERVATVLTLFALPIFVDFMAMLMTLLLGFTSDISNDFEFYDTIEILTNRQRDWIRISCAGFIPLAVLALSFFYDARSPVQNFLMAAIAGNLLLFTIYLVYTFALEAVSCMNIIQGLERTQTTVDTLESLVALQFVSRFALVGTRKAQLLSWQKRFYTAFSRPKRMWELENVLRPRPVYTQKRGIFFLCYMHLSKIRGAIPKVDFAGSLLCIGVVVFLVWLLISGILVFYDFVPTGIDVIISAILAVVFVVYLVIHYRNYRRYVKEDGKFSAESSIADWDEEHFLGRRPSNINAAAWRKLCEARDTRFCYAEPKRGTVVAIAVMQFVCAIAIPVGSFYALGVTGFGTVYLIASLLTVRSGLFNVHKLIEIYGPDALEALDFPWPRVESEASEQGQGVKNGRRLYFLLTRMKKREVKSCWFVLLSIGISIAILLIAISVDRDTSEKYYQGPQLIGSAGNLTHAYMPLTDGLSASKHSVCAIETRLPLSATLTVTDFAFLSDLAYAESSVSQLALDQWFGISQGRYRHIGVERYPIYSQPLSSKVVFTLVEHRGNNWDGDGKGQSVNTTTFIIALRGTIKGIDLLADMQLWFPAIMFQFLRFFMPFGSVWNDVIAALIGSFNVLESAPYQHISYLTDVIQFIRTLRQKHPRANVLLTGHSLGGGVAILAGAMEEAPAIAISGVNAMLSRRKFGIAKEALDKYSLNLMPRGDVVTWVDDPALLVETIACRSTPQSGRYVLFKCHSVQRTVCELQYTCGSGSRPPYKACSRTYKYPSPQSVQARDGRQQRSPDSSLPQDGDHTYGARGSGHAQRTYQYRLTFEDKSNDYS